MKSILLVVALIVLGGCAETLDVTSSRSLIYPRERYAKRGTVCVMRDPKNSTVQPNEDDLVEARIVEDAFKQKGFSISEEPRSAQFGFMFASLMKPVGESIRLSVNGTFYELGPEGDVGRVLWDARVAGPVNPSEWRERRRTFLKAMLKLFPN